MSSIDPVVSEKMFENVDGRRIDAGVTGILIAHLGAFRSAELKIGECHATDYVFLPMWYKFEVRKFSPFVR